MAFRIREITVHLMAAPGPCMPASPEPTCPEATCKPTKKPKEPAGGGGRPAGGEKRRSLDLLRARLREALAPLPA